MVIDNRIREGGSVSLSAREENLPARINLFHFHYLSVIRKVKSAYEPSGPLGRSVSRVL